MRATSTWQQLGSEHVTSKEKRFIFNFTQGAIGQDNSSTKLSTNPSCVQHYEYNSTPVYVPTSLDDQPTDQQQQKQQHKVQIHYFDPDNTSNSQQQFFLSKLNIARYTGKTNMNRILTP